MVDGSTADDERCDLTFQASPANDNSPASPHDAWAMPRLACMRTAFSAHRRHAASV